MNQLIVAADRAPALIAAAGARASYRFFEFFTAQIRNPHTRRTYARGARIFRLAGGGLGAAMLAGRNFKGIRRKRLSIFVSGADHATGDIIGIRSRDRSRVKRRHDQLIGRMRQATEWVWRHGFLVKGHVSRHFTTGAPPRMELQRV